MPLAPGVRLGPYEILSPLGTGGMGEVYRARDEQLHRDVAIKVLPERTTGRDEAVGRFEREARAVATLSHPNIVAVHSFSSEGGIRYLVMGCSRARLCSSGCGAVPCLLPLPQRRRRRSLMHSRPRTRGASSTGTDATWFFGSQEVQQANIGMIENVR